MLQHETMLEPSSCFISVVIVNYNGAPWLERCLASLLAQTFQSFEIIFVDNASTDASCALVQQHFPQVKLIRSETNVGFAAGNNLGIRAARGAWIATLNTDTSVANDYLEKLSEPVRATGDTARIGACAPLMLQMERPDLVDAAGLYVDAFGFAWNIGAGLGANEFSAAREVYGACAGAALYRRAMLDEIGLFDDDFFGFYEDADLAQSAHRAGWKTILVPAARVFHTHGASFGKIAPRKTYLLARNRWWSMFKNFPMPQFVLVLPLLLVADFVSLLQAVRRGHGFQAWQGRADAWRSRKKLWAKRQS